MNEHHGFIEGDENGNSIGFTPIDWSTIELLQSAKPTLMERVAYKVNSVVRKIKKNQPLNAKAS